MARKELYRIKSGTLTNNAIDVKIVFGLVYENDGFIEFDFYTEDKYDMSNLHTTVSFGNSDIFDAKCLTIDNLPLNAYHLYYTSISPIKNQIKMVCYDRITITKSSSHLNPSNNSNDLPIYYLVLEGLSMHYCTRPENKYEVLGQNNASVIEYNHTGTALYFAENSYLLDYRKDYENEGSVIVKFRNNSNSLITYKKYLDFKRDYVTFLSFINGGTVKVRSEYYGNYCYENSLGAEITEIYSFRKLLNEKLNRYIPLNNFANTSVNILNKFQIQNFESFIEWNKKIDLSPIIHYLNGAIQTESLEEQFFILIIAFEKLTTSYAKQYGSLVYYLPEAKIFDPIKSELLEVIRANKEKFENQLNRVESIIGGLNQVKRLSTQEKMENILINLNIKITPRIEKLINEVRHTAIHEGNVGNDEEIYGNVVLLNDLIHEIIIQLIKYDGPKKGLPTS